MPKLGVKWKLSAGAILGCLALAWALSEPGRAQPKVAEKPVGKEGKPADELKKVYLPAQKGCGTARCHGATKPSEDEVVCRLTEVTLWSKEDKHVDAYKVLLDARSQDMGKRLGKDVTDPATGCVACHGGVSKDDPALDKNFKVKDEGVSCSLCHGPYKNWYGPHALYTDVEEWRKYPRDKKESQFGMTDLWNPVKRAALCASCHIGSHEEKRFVTHDMYAAGHPPLPSFEIASFSDQMPRHWQYLREKSKTARDLLQYPGTDKLWEQTQMVLVGAVVNLRESMKLLAGQAADCEKAPAGSDNAVLDLSNFDCYACHHDLRTPSWRQRRGYTGKPGRLPMPVWPTALVKLAIHHAAKDAAEETKLTGEYDALVKKVQAGYSAQVYGDLAQIKPAALALAKWADDLAARVNNVKETPCAAEAAEKARKFLTETAGNALDYDSARQVAWAFQELEKERQEIKKEKPTPEAGKILELLEKRLKLEFPQGRKPIVDDLPARMKARNAFDAAPFPLDLRTPTEAPSRE